MQMVEPDYWKGRGRYSKQALTRKVEDESPFHPSDSAPETESKD